jgi:hypothetical protein
MARGLEALGRGGDPIPRLNSRSGRSEGGARRGAEGGDNGGGRWPSAHTQRGLRCFGMDYQEWKE